MARCRNVDFLQYRRSLALCLTFLLIVVNVEKSLDTVTAGEL